MRRDPRAGLGKGNATLLTVEQRHAQPFLEQLHLIAHRRLGHPQLFGRTGEIAVARRSLEHAYGSKRGKITHGYT